MINTFINSKGHEAPPKTFTSSCLSFNKYCKEINIIKRRKPRINTKETNKQPSKPQVYVHQVLLSLLRIYTNKALSLIDTQIYKKKINIKNAYFQCKSIKTKPSTLAASQIKPQRAPFYYYLGDRLYEGPLTAAAAAAAVAAVAAAAAAVAVYRSRGGSQEDNLIYLNNFDGNNAQLHLLKHQ